MIYIVSHKPVNLPDFSGYKLLQVGSCDENFPGFLRDNTGDNIARKNANYCELTAMYWIWRNVREDHKGLVHYRRFFGRRLFGNLGDVLSYEALMDTLKGHDILIPRPVVYHTSAKEQLLMESCTDDTFEKLTAVFYGIHPDCMADYEA
ncbi:MAG: DUF4422 domain-containing protein, partial [Clostridia bacterium]|nr:DUF4422 domain-containing protein [Clostridia bacterium]